MRYRIIIERMEDQTGDYEKFYEQIIDTKDDTDIKNVINTINE